MTSGTVRVERVGGVGVLTLDDPDRRNVLSAAAVDAVADAVQRLEDDGDVRALVVTGAGSAFCAGAELSTLEQSASGDFSGVQHVYEGFLRVLRTPLLTIAAVNGPAVGAGMNLALACDVRIASTAARFDTRFVQLRLHPGGGHTWLLERAVGYQRAVLAVLLGERWDAAQALQHGLVAQVTEPGDLLDTAVALGARLDDVEPALAQRVLATLRAASQAPTHEEVLAAETEAQRWSVTRPEFVEHVRELSAAISRR